MNRSIAAVILAAGRSRRMGTPKQLLTIAGTPMIRRVATIALEAELAPIVAVMPHDRVYRDALAGLPDVSTLAIADSGSPGESLRAGIAALPPACPGAIVLLADMPFVTSELLTFLAATDEPRAVDHDGVPGPPAFLPAPLLERLADTTCERPLRAILLQHQPPVSRYVSSTSLIDIDTPADYVAAQRVAAAGFRAVSPEP